MSSVLGLFDEQTGDRLTCLLPGPNGSRNRARRLEYAPLGISSYGCWREGYAKGTFNHNVAISKTIRVAQTTIRE
jgi:hypothetical protein